MVSGDDAEAALRFRETALAHLDDVYTLARYLLGNAADAEDATQECFLRAFKHFESFRGGAVKPWLFAILRNVCRSEWARRGSAPAPSETTENDATAPLWTQDAATPEAAMLRRLDDETIRRLIAALPDEFRETIVLREVSELSYREIAEVTGAPVGTVMSRLARGRALLRTAWLAAEQEGAPA
jgi:RNA polymerase sigma-70 factor (ECF subfamily)